MLRFITLTFLIVVSGLFSLVATAQDVVFEDQFEGRLQPGWVWVHDNPARRRFVNDALEIFTEPFANGEARNALLRPLNFLRWQNGRLQYAYRIETECSFLEKPTEQYQQCGVYWLQNERVIFKLVFANIDGELYVFPGKAPLGVKNGGRLRIDVVGQNIVASFCPEDEKIFQRVYEGRINSTPNDRISLQCWNGPQASTPLDNWVRFRYFRIERLE
ncbi:MAG: hypothetical protein Q4G03_04680 [Planctomycetia bacterium]|nr:hypothetical protein [Planctomycetia bacterium]